MGRFRNLFLRLVLTVVFYALVTPLSLVLRILGFDPLSLRQPRQSSTFWKPRSDRSPRQVHFTKVR
ncbi:MAG: hypothetical protein EBT09_06055 [Actinobacteria bacterium]|nr:hypothetical protein [Actinomycetota bacterium]